MSKTHTFCRSEFGNLLFRASRLRTSPVALILTSLLLANGRAEDASSRTGESPQIVETNVSLVDTAALRRPIAMVGRGSEVLIANERSGTLSLLDLSASPPVVRSEFKAADRIADMAAIPGSTAVLLLDSVANRLLRAEYSTGRLLVTELCSVPHASHRLLVSTNRHEVFVSTRWSRQLVAIALDDHWNNIIRQRVLSLPFAGGELLLLDDGSRLIVSDSFSGRLLMVDTDGLTPVGETRVDGTNIRGIADSDDGRHIYITQQVLNPLIRTDFDGVHWGSLVANGVQVVSPVELQDAVASNQSLSQAGWLHEFGGIGNATGDPGVVITGANGFVAVALSGVGEVFLRRGHYSSRITVGRRPAALLEHGSRLFVANQFDDSITIINSSSGDVTETIPLGPMSELSAADRGELLFFDAKLSHDGWMSCHSCHTDGHTSELLIDTLGDGDYGAPKRVPSLLATADTAPWAWAGTSGTLSDQVRKSITTTMHGDAPTNQQIDDLVAFLLTLPAPPQAATVDTDAVARGRAVFTNQGCGKCHAPPTYTTADVYDVGLQDELGRVRFNPPTLRGVGHRRRFFHDGRAARLHEVLLESGHGRTQPLTSAEAAALISFLKSL